MKISIRTAAFLLPPFILLACGGREQSSPQSNQSIQATTPPSYDDWSSAYFSNPADRDPSADPDQDGISNLEEYATGTDPTVPSTRSLQIFYTTIGAEKYLSMEFPISVSATDIAVTVEVTFDLQTWNTSANGIVVTDRIVGGKSQVRLARWVSADPISQMDRQFARVRFTRKVTKAH